ncbi:hypothetical protein ACJJTC_004826 [Scirpophaga incertulas]
MLSVTSSIRGNILNRKLNFSIVRQFEITILFCSSLLIVYEGDVQCSSAEETTSGLSGEYDADASSSSTEQLPVSHFDMSTLQQGISTGTPREPFQPHNEETMGGYEEGEVTHTLRPHPPSPDSADSWMAYSSASGESWRGPPDSEAEVVATDPKTGNKRAHTWTDKPRDDRVDIRMIDFAHTAYAGAAAESPLATAAPHHGPDCGFLTGIDSLKRLLTEILPPQPYS